MRIRRSSHERGFSSLAMRLTLAFVGVTLLAIMIVASLAFVLGQHRIQVMVDDRRADLIRSLEANAVATYDSRRGGWTDTDWTPALDLAVRYGTNVAVLDRRGRLVAGTAISPLTSADARRSQLTVGPEPVGTLVVSFTGGLKESADDLRRSLVAALVGATGLAALTALGAALLLSRRLAAPLVVLIDAAGAMSRGRRDVRIRGLRGVPRELQDLATSFDTMADALAHQEQLRRDLVADVAHELRTPVAILQANLEGLADGVVEFSQEQAESLGEEVRRLAARVEDLQQLARADAAALSLRLETCDLAELAGGVVEQLAAQAAAAAVEIRTELTPAHVAGDPARLHQVITNLLLNALKFTPSGGSVHVSVRTDPDSVLLAVRDTGIGIDEGELPHVFERFWRSSAVSGVGGTGVGLAIVAQLVAAHGGKVDISSELGAGTEVVVVLPLVAAAAAAGPRTVVLKPSA